MYELRLTVITPESIIKYCQIDHKLPWLGNKCLLRLRKIFKIFKRVGLSACVLREVWP